jgi:hypothetical protein
VDEVHLDISVICGEDFGRPLMLPLHNSPCVYAASQGVFFLKESLLLTHEKNFLRFFLGCVSYNKGKEDVGEGSG